MLIGAGGRTLKEIGTAARLELEKMLGCERVSGDAGQGGTELDPRPAQDGGNWAVSPRAAKSANTDAREARAGRSFGAGLPTVVLVGRANAGKSTLFNRIAKGSRAITSPIPGTTRDLNFARASYR